MLPAAQFFLNLCKAGNHIAVSKQRAPAAQAGKVALAKKNDLHTVVYAVATVKTPTPQIQIFRHASTIVEDSE